MPDSVLEYWHSIVPSTPAAIRRHFLSLPHETVHAVDALLRFVLDGPCPPVADDDIRSAWDTSQSEASWRIAQLRKTHRKPSPPSVNHKRGREDVSPAPSTAPSPSSPKRVRTDNTQDATTNNNNTASSSSSTPPTPASSDADDPPLFTLHSLSLTSPIRKKADITIHKHTLRLTNSTGAGRKVESPPIPLTALRRAFLLPTRGKPRPHWSVLMMPSDVPVAPGKAGAEARGRERAGVQAPIVAFGVDAVPAGVMGTSTYDADGTPRMTVHPKATPVEPALRAFLGHFHAPPTEPSTEVFRSAVGGGGGAGEGGDGVAGVEAYRGAKAGTLWFLSVGILWDGKPPEFFALRDVARADGEGEDQVEGVRTLSATGRTCTVVVRRVERARGTDGESVVEVDFGMVEGREREGIARWVRRYRHLFGEQEAQAQAMQTDGAGPSGANAAAAAAVGDEEDEDDEDFVASESDGGSATSESEEDGDGEGAESVEEEEAEASDADGDGYEDGEGELDPAHHPLLRPGAMPKRISRAAMEMVVGMMEGDLVGAGGADGDEDEADELEE